MSTEQQGGIGLEGSGEGEVLGAAVKGGPFRLVLGARVWCSLLLHAMHMIWARMPCRGRLLVGLFRCL